MTREEFFQTKIGKAFLLFESKLMTAVQRDTKLEYAEDYNPIREKRAKEAWELSDQAKKELIELLIEVYDYS